MCDTLLENLPGARTALPARKSARRQLLNPSSSTGSGSVGGGYFVVGRIVFPSSELGLARAVTVLLAHNGGGVARRTGLRVNPAQCRCECVPTNKSGYDLS
jgi:hypothetical protein